MYPNLFAWEDRPAGEIDVNFFDWPFVYLHNAAEDIMSKRQQQIEESGKETSHAPDIFYADQPMPTQSGSYTVLIYGQPATAVSPTYEGRYGRTSELNKHLSGRVFLNSEPNKAAIDHCNNPKEWR